MTTWIKKAVPPRNESERREPPSGAERFTIEGRFVVGAEMTELEIANDICLGKLRVPDKTRVVNDPRDTYPSELTAAEMLARAFVSQLRGSRRDGFNAGKAHAAEIVKAAGYPDLAEKILKGSQ